MNDASLMAGGVVGISLPWKGLSTTYPPIGVGTILYARPEHAGRDHCTWEDVTMLHYQPVRRAARSALVIAGIAAYSVFAIVVMAAVFILAGA